MMKIAAEGRQVPITSATKKQLRAFAEHLGCTITNFENEDAIRKKIANEGYEEPFIIAFEPEPKTAKGKPAGAAKAAPGEVLEPKVTLTIHVQEGPGGKRPVFVGVNGVGMLISRNVRSLVKLRYLRCLENAIETKYEWDDKANINVPSDMPAYPYQIHAMPSEAEQARWYAYEAEQEKKRLAADRLLDKAAAKEFAAKLQQMMAA